jgi:hypothetical protein
VASDGAEFRGTASAVRILGNPGFTDLNSIDGKCALDIWGSQLMLGSDDASNTRGSNTSKYSFIVMPHYANISVRPLALFYGYSLAGSTRLALGGGSNRFNAVTELTFHTGATTVTREGTERARFNNIGQLLIATTTAAIDSAVKLKLNGGMEISPGGFALIATDTQVTGYALTVGGVTASGVYVLGDVNADQFTDRSDAPESLAEAYAIVQSHETKAGKVDHSKLHSAAWGRKFRVVETGKTLTKTREIAPAEDGKEAVTEEYSEPEKVVVSEPDRSGRNLSMVISAQSMVIKSLLSRIEALEAK